jgi:hypothetical protein
MLVSLSKPSAGNRKLADIYYKKVMNGGDVNAIPSILGDDFTFTIPTHPEVFRGIKGFEEEVSGLHGAFPDVHLNVHHRWIFDDLILGLWTGTGTHVGNTPLSTPAGPLAATGNSFRIEGVSWIKADGQKLRENLANEDTLRIVHDLGVRDCSAMYRAASAALVQQAQFPSGTSVNVASTHELLTNDVLLNHPLIDHQSRGRGKFTSFFNCYWSAFENVDIQITHSKCAAGVNAYRWLFEADHVRRFFGIAASGKRIQHQGVSICVASTNGEIEQVYINENLIMLLSQMESST